MKAVGIKILKNNLSKYLDMVREGEIVYVTDRDDIIAEIHKPISAPTSILSRWEAFLNEEERKGSLVRAKHAGPSRIKELAAKLSSGPALPGWKKMLDESREDRA
jgi:antitoxin (DNA-binding transcriptional repressor) of toxin-antitoxin stability system